VTPEVAFQRGHESAFLIRRRWSQAGYLLVLFWQLLISLKNLLIERASNNAGV
jgi:hypothetical protein